jgi:putative spermidine/putrescine transport system ATP-binding protein
LTPAPPDAPPAIEVDGLVKRFADQLAVNEVSMQVAAGEMVCLLGPSGCGKTTTLNLIAGFLTPDAGRVKLAGREVGRLSPHRRGLGMVFQSYALFPHLSVRDNVAFGLDVRGLSRRDARARAAEMLALVRLDAYADRMPHQLSGGQQQRVSLARALAYAPQVLLLDEPFSSLDAKLRVDLRHELKDIQQRLGIAALFVTHDQEEALQLADRVIVMRNGRIAQQGRPHAVYFQPTSRFVADFLGDANFVAVRLGGEGIGLARDGTRWRIPPPDDRPTAGRDGMLMLRPERIALVSMPSEAGMRNRTEGTVLRTSFRGAHQTVDVQVGDAVWRVSQAGTAVRGYAPGKRVVLAWEPEDGRFLDAEDLADA